MNLQTDGIYVIILFIYCMVICVKTAIQKFITCVDTSVASCMDMIVLLVIFLNHSCGASPCHSIELFTGCTP